jgi:hypothetical protein
MSELLAAVSSPFQDLPVSDSRQHVTAAKSLGDRRLVLRAVGGWQRREEASGCSLCAVLPCSTWPRSGLPPFRYAGGCFKLNSQKPAAITTWTESPNGGAVDKLDFADQNHNCRDRSRVCRRNATAMNYDGAAPLAEFEVWPLLETVQ